jgi:hypothetical protein
MVTWLLIGASVLLLSGCALFDPIHAQIFQCDKMAAGAVEPVEIDVGIPLISTPHSYNCTFDPPTMQTTDTYTNDGGKWVHTQSIVTTPGRGTIVQSEQPSTSSIASVLENPIETGLSKVTIPAY